MSENEPTPQVAPDLKTREVVVAEERLRLEKACSEREHNVKLKGQRTEIIKWCIGGIAVCVSFFLVTMREQARLDKQFMLETHKAMLEVMDTSNFDTLRRKLSYLDVVADTMHPGIKTYVQTLHNQLMVNEGNHNAWVNATMAIASLASRLDNATAKSAIMEAASQGSWKSLADISNDVKVLTETSGGLTAANEKVVALGSQANSYGLSLSHIPSALASSAASYVNATSEKDLLETIKQVATKRAELGQDLKSGGIATRWDFGGGDSGGSSWRGGSGGSIGQQ